MVMTVKPLAPTAVDGGGGVDCLVARRSKSHHAFNRRLRLCMSLYIVTHSKDSPAVSRENQPGTNDGT